jgi:ribose-phosphate pyrophosphokinase
MDVIIVDDMISSGESLIDVSRKLKERGAKRIFAFISFSLFVDGLEKFDKAFEEGYFEKIFSTNMVYAKPELLEREWFVQADMSKYISLIIDTLYWNKTMADLLDPVKRIKNFLVKKGKIAAK